MVRAPTRTCNECGRPCWNKTCRTCYCKDKYRGKLSKLKRSRFVSVFLSIMLLFSCWVVLSGRQVIVYESGVYDCFDMTKNCKVFFDTIGIKNTVVHGYNYHGLDDIDTHCWLELEFPFGSFEFECTTLSFLKTSDNYRNCWVTVDNSMVMWK